MKLPPARRRSCPLLVLACLALGALPAAAGAQHAPAPSAPASTSPGGNAAAASGPAVIPAGELSVQYVRARHTSAREMARVLQGLHQRHYLVRNEDGSVTGPFMNIDSFGELVVLHDTPAQLAVLSRALEQLDTGLAAGKAPAAPPAAALRVQEYVPRHQSVTDMERALMPFRRNLVNGSPDSAGAPLQVPNVTVLEEPALLVLRDTEENLASMLALLSRLDVPAPQLLMTCTLLRAVTPGSGETPAEGLPPELLAGLRRLVPYQEFAQVGFAALRVSVTAGRELALRGRSTDDLQFQLLLRPAGFDAAAGLLALDRCKFEAAGGQEFETGITLRAGEDTVLGASGVEPLFVLLRVTPLDG